MLQNLKQLYLIFDPNIDKMRNIDHKLKNFLYVCGCKKVFCGSEQHFLGSKDLNMRIWSRHLAGLKTSFCASKGIVLWI